MAVMAAPLASRKAEFLRLMAVYQETRDPRDRARVIENQLGLAELLARRYGHRGVPLDDLIQIARLGLIKAVERFDPSKGLAFGTFATPTIVGELKRHFRDKSWSMRMPRSVQENYLRVSQVIDELCGELGRTPTRDEIAKRSGLTPECVTDALDASQAYRTTSIEGVADLDDSAPLARKLGELDPQFDRVEDWGALAAAIRAIGLSERNQLVLHLRFVEGKTQAEISAQIGVSQMQVSRLLRQIVKRLREVAVLEDAV